MIKYVKPKMCSGQPVWELPVKEDARYGKRTHIDKRVKYHCFVDGDSLCNRYGQDTDFYDTDIASGEIMAFPVVACRVCFEKWKRKFYVGQN